MPAPAWLASMVQVPGVKKVTVEPEIEQTVELSAGIDRRTERPEDAVAVATPAVDGTRAGQGQPVEITGGDTGGHRTTRELHQGRGRGRAGRAAEGAVAEL